MKLSQLLKGFTKSSIKEDVEILGITANDSDVLSGYAYICKKGIKTSGIKYIDSAIKNGAICIVYDDSLQLPKSNHIQYFAVENLKEKYPLMCKRIYGKNIDLLKIVAVTGTNGKTSIVNLINQFLSVCLKKTGQLSTVGNIINSQVEKSEYTTPLPEIIYKYLKKMVDYNCEYALLEASSQALDQNRLGGLTFEYGIFTNLTGDHLDYHKTIENYYKAKRKLFGSCKVAIINIDDSFGNRLKDEVNCKVLTVSSINKNADYYFKIIKKQSQSQTFTLQGNNINQTFTLPLIGEYNVYNCVQSLVVCINEGCNINELKKSMINIKPPKGRMEKVNLKMPFTVYIDYAHTADGLENALKALKETNPKKLTCLFGCGGDRDKTKRPIMGSIATSMCNKVVITSDNPRSEDPKTIIDEIVLGVNNNSCEIKVIQNRKQAIEYVLATAMVDETIIIAGKGHENYQITNQGKIPFDEKEIIFNYIKIQGDSNGFNYN